MSVDGTAEKGTGVVFLLGLTCAVSAASIIVSIVALFEFKEVAANVQVASGQWQTLAQQNAEILKHFQRPALPVAAPMPFPQNLPAPEQHPSQRRQAEKEPTQPKDEIPGNGEFTLLERGKSSGADSSFKLLGDK